MDNGFSHIYGLIGYPLEHSFSPAYFRQIFEKSGMNNCDYRLFPVRDIESFSFILNDIPHLYGLNVTIPYKEAIIPWLNELSPEAKLIGAVNVIKIIHKGTKIQTIGHNTDAAAFIRTLLPLLRSHHSQAMIFGCGGATKAVAYSLSLLGIPYIIVSRGKKGPHIISYEELSISLINKYPVLINCTPVGMFSYPDEALSIPFEGIGPRHLVYDLTYNPPLTQLLKIAQQRGATTANGLQMLHYQADLSWEFWNDR
ncbi:MAG TPA: shikimate dehydrogenase [Bacteroidales bacterium]|jgi:shikimate dehydrogenase|nr:shikimate dehydrogenase [Bacteroidales bacterium]MDI9574155.1 shikimate dehydrogenase [Bacteroidota bacterium]OQC61048.1 MAG: Shikimate dehydrogenase [Bacteroidetes bacterium ADurb.Bin012]MBP9512465.1 shikimate dehydrogenase [Bacteroidales bacterium]MBP9587998.1 shikimate dehydrogenase [Bacteroidales bacterium]